MVLSKRAMMFSLLTGSLVLWSAYASNTNTDFCENFAVHAGTSVTFADSDTISNGDLSGSSFVGPAYELTDGAIASPHEPALFDDSVQAAWVAAMESRAGGHATAIEFGDKTFTPGTYRSDTINIVAGTNVTLDGQNDPNSVFLFQAVATLLTGVGCKIVLINGAKAENVLWALGSTFTTGTNTDFQGSILAGSTITVAAYNSMHGAIVARTTTTFGATTEIVGCVVALGTVTFGTHNSVTVPQPADSACGSDVKLVRKIGVATYTDNPITIISQTSSKNDEVTFQISQEWMPDSLSYLFVRFQDKDFPSTKCRAFKDVNGAWKSSSLTAICTRSSKIAFVEVWTSDATFSAESDGAVLHPDCSGMTTSDDLLPTVKYVFQVECVSACVDCATGSATGSES